MTTNTQARSAFTSDGCATLASAAAAGKRYVVRLHHIDPERGAVGELDRLSLGTEGVGDLALDGDRL